MNAEDVKNYVKKYLKRTFVEPIEIDVKNGRYTINNTLNFEIYDFWDKTDKELLNDFDDFSFRGDNIGLLKGFKFIKSLVGDILKRKRYKISIKSLFG